MLVKRYRFDELMDRAADPAPLWQITGDGAPVDPAIVIDLDDVRDWTGPGIAAVLRLLDGPTPVLVGAATRPLDVAAAPVLERLTLTIAPAGPGRSWIAPASHELALATVTGAVRRSPYASTTLAAVLRCTARLPVADALTVESLAYSTLLGGAEFQQWLGPRPSPRAILGDEPVVLTRRGDRLHIELNRPDRHNAFGRAMRDGLIEALAVAESDHDVTEVVLTGRGPSFSSGGDLDEFGSFADPVSAHMVRTARSAGLAVHRIADRVEARVHGAVVGAGVEVAGFAHRVVASPDAWFCLPEVGMGLIPGAGGTVSVPQRIGRWRAAWMALTGVRLDVGTALAWGLVDEIR